MLESNTHLPLGYCEILMAQELKIAKNSNFTKETNIGKLLKYSNQ